MDLPPACQLLSNGEALAVVTLAQKRLRSPACTIPKERRKEVTWTVTKAAKHLSGAADVAATARVLDALAGAGVDALARLQLVNSKAVTEFGAYLVNPDYTAQDPAALAAIVAKALPAPPNDVSSTRER